jgi:hypothetical protein
VGRGPATGFFLKNASPLASEGCAAKQVPQKNASPLRAKVFFPKKRFVPFFKRPKGAPSILVVPQSGQQPDVACGQQPVRSTTASHASTSLTDLFDITQLL